MEKNSKEVESNQTGVHEDLMTVLNRFKENQYKKPYAIHTVEVYRETYKGDLLDYSPVILDLGCGTAKSTLHLADMFKESMVLGIDKSEVRLSKSDTQIKNTKTLHCDLVDFIRLMKNEGRKSDLTCLFYPNPWPKKEHLKRRIHAHPFFKDLVDVSKEFVMRTNWKTLAEETKISYEYYSGKELYLSEVDVEVGNEMTAFEKKYSHSDQCLYEVGTTPNWKELKL